MRKAYILEDREVKVARDKLDELWTNINVCRNVNDIEAEKEFRAKYKGAVEIMQILHLIRRDTV